MISDAYSLAPTPAAAPALGRTLSFSVPIADQGEFGNLRPKWRQDIVATLGVLKQAHALRLRGGYAWCSGTLQLAHAHRHLKGMSAVRIRAKYKLYVESGGDWRSLIKGYKSPGGQPPAFVEFMRGLIEQSPRGVAAACAYLREELWPSGVSIPGYGTWVEWFTGTWPDQPVPTRFPRVYPSGWSPEQLARHQPSRAARAMMQQGIAEAHNYLPKLKRDTSALRPMEIIVIDDFELDHRSTFAGDPERNLPAQIAPVGGLLAKCVGTRKNLAWLLGPRVLRDVRQPDGSIKQVRCNIRTPDVQALLYAVFRDHGLPDYDVTILCETKSATILPALEQFLLIAFGGRVRVQRTSLIEHKTLANGFVEGGGTPWEKGWIESDFNWNWNQLALRLEGWKGSNQRLNGPANDAAKEIHVLRFIGADAAGKKLNLPPEVIEMLKLPFPSFATMEAAFAQVMAAGERRTRHRFNGFDKVTEYVWKNPKLPAPAGIDAHEPNPYRALALLTPEQQEELMVPRERNECALERWERLSAAHPRGALQAAVLALFLLTPNKAKWINHAVSFTLNKVGYSYVDDDGILAGVPERTDLFAYVDFSEPASAVVTHVDGRPLGIVRMLGDSPRGVDITDPEASAEARARRAKLVNLVQEMLRKRPLHQETDARTVADAAHNERVVTTYQAAVADLPTAEKIATARGDIAAKAKAEAAAKVKPDQLLSARARAAAASETSENETHPAESNQDASWV
ncbi:MAG: hypothetical protein H7067_08120 [Burkholderiales bacterium]|nr:hypothetical protein [Opitutaceae bacterium]